MCIYINVFLSNHLFTIIAKNVKKILNSRTAFEALLFSLMRFTVSTRDKDKNQLKGVEGCQTISKGLKIK